MFTVDKNVHAHGLLRTVSKACPWALMQNKATELAHKLTLCLVLTTHSIHQSGCEPLSILNAEKRLGSTAEC